MRTTVDAGGRIVLPKVLRQQLGLKPGSTVDVSAYGDGLFVAPGGRTAELIRDDDGRLVATSDTVVDDAMIFDILDDLRR